MVFRTGAITDAAPGPALYNALESYMISDGWEFVETVIIGANTHKVLRSPAAGNVRNITWYLDFMFPTTGAGSLYLMPYEDYNATTHLAYRGIIAGSTHGGTIEQTYFSRYGATGYGLETTWITSPTPAPNMKVALSTSAFTYYVSVTRNRIMMIVTNQATSIAYTGFFTPTTAFAAYAGAALNPLVMAIIPNNGSAAGGTQTLVTMQLTRMPRYTVVPGGNSWSSICYTTQIPTLFSGAVGVAPNKATNETVIMMQPVYIGGAQPTIEGAFVGYFDGLAQGLILNTAVRGDTVTVGTDLWYCVTPSSGSTVFMQAV